MFVDRAGAQFIGQDVHIERELVNDNNDDNSEQRETDAYNVVNKECGERRRYFVLAVILVEYKSSQDFELNETGW